MFDNVLKNAGLIMFRRIINCWIMFRRMLNWLIRLRRMLNCLIMFKKNAELFDNV